MEVAAHLDWDSTMYQLRAKAVSHLWAHEKLREKKKICISNMAMRPDCYLEISEKAQTVVGT